MKNYTLVGEKLSYSFSPQIHNIILEHIGMEANYNLTEIPLGELEVRFPEAIKKYHGLNITIPYKKDVLKLLHDLDDVSREIGAVNTVKITEDKTKGYNTDYFGFGATLKKYKVPIKNKKAYIIGTGGASKAVYYYLKNNNTGEIVFINRNKNTHWAKDSKILTYEECKGVKGDLVINATPLGMDKLVNNSPLEKGILKNFDHAVDLIYNPRETLFLQYAKEYGLQSINGLYMLVAQAIKSEEIWNDVIIKEEVMDQIFQKVESLIYG